MYSALKPSLEQIAVSLREVLEIGNGKVLKKDDFHFLVSKIQEVFTYITIKFVNYDIDPILELKDREKFIIILSEKKGLKDKFDDLLRVFTYAIIFDKKTLNEYELEKYQFNYGQIYNDENASYLMLAFILPKDVFLHEMVKYSYADRVEIFKMEEEVSKYVYKRGQDLEIW